MRSLALAARRSKEALVIPRRRRDVQPVGHGLRSQPLRRSEVIARHRASAEPPLRPEPKRGPSLFVCVVIEPDPAAKTIDDPILSRRPARPQVELDREVLSTQDRLLRRRNAGAKPNRASWSPKSSTVQRFIQAVGLTSTKSITPSAVAPVRMNKTRTDYGGVQGPRLADCSTH